MIEDMIRIVWLLASNDQVKVPMAWIEDFKMNAKRVKTPPTLPPVELEALIGNFHYFASDGGGFGQFRRARGVGAVGRGPGLQVHDRVRQQRGRGIGRDAAP